MGFYGWMHQLPVIGFNSGKYDLNAIKQFLIPYFLSTSKTEEQEEQEEEEQKEQADKDNYGIGSFFFIKRNNTFMCLSKDQLTFLDMTNYIAPGYLKAYGCELTNGHFPYEYMGCLERLDDTARPSKEAFFNRLKNEGISDEDYASCQEAWRDNAMTTLRDFIVWYNNRDVVPFLQAIDRQFAFYQQRGIDIFKRGISVPGLTLFYLFNDLPEKTYFTIFNEKNKNHLVAIVQQHPPPQHRYSSACTVTTVRACPSCVCQIACASASTNVSSKKATRRIGAKSCSRYTRFIPPIHPCTE